MDRPSDKDKSSKRSRDDRDRDHDRDREREHKHRHRDRDEKHREREHHHHRSSSDHKSLKREDREGSRDRDFKREKSHDDHRESRRDRERSHEREGTKHREREVKREELDANDVEIDGRKKRKEREESEERGEKKARVLDDKRGKRRFEDSFEKQEDSEGVSDNVNVNEVNVKKEVSDDDVTVRGGSANSNGATLESLNVVPRTVPETSMATGDHPLPTKVSSIYTTNENKGVSITRSHEVPGKSSTDGTSSAAGKSGSLSLDALAKAKKALQMQKELSEKLKKIPLLNKGTSSDGSLVSGLKDGVKLPSSGTGIMQGTGSTTGNALSSGAMPSSSNLPAAAAASVKPPASGVPTIPGLTNIPNIEAVKRAQELAAKMGFRQDPEFAPLINLFPGQMPTDVAAPQKPTKAPVLRVDALGREIDEHGNVVNVTKPNNLSTLKVNINKQKKDAFQILKPELEVDPESNPHYDQRMGVNKTKLLRPKRMTFQFVEEGKWSKEAEILRVKSQFGEAGAKERQAKQAQLAKVKGGADINPNLIEVAERVVTKEKPKDPIPEIEWWDKPLLLNGSYGDISDGGIVEDKLKKEKITIYVEHPRPIEPPAEPAPPPPQPLKLTKKEQKKLRTQRRLAREKDRQEMIRQGLIEPPKPKVKMSNLMKVLGSEATQDPTRLEKEIRSAAAEREQAHIDRNVARKLTPAERREKKERKLFDDSNSLDTIVSVYKINDLSHPKTRFKVDVNAHENRLTGCVVITEGISVVVVEGGSKSIKRYGMLMLRRIDWAKAVNEEDEDKDEISDKPVNKCMLVWQGSVAKPSFNRFSVHECMTEAAAKKVFADAGVAHYWDLAVNFTDDQM
ncbi:protein RDM16 isoform X1 [Pistacia vera]|uniref:protein RDM16 isoform X1 n=3 Tax=Pistacia vera TaxID=55513 RepID=UPI001262BFE0|nr:protein RDM16 isoform X1 [Pistacia vera]